MPILLTSFCLVALRLNTPIGKVRTMNCACVIADCRLSGSGFKTNSGIAAAYPPSDHRVRAALARGQCRARSDTSRAGEFRSEESETSKKQRGAGSIVPMARKGVILDKSRLPLRDTRVPGHLNFESLEREVEPPSQYASRSARPAYSTAGVTAKLCGQIPISLCLVFSQFAAKLILHDPKK